MLTPWRLFHITLYENMLSNELYLRHVFAFVGVYNEPTGCEQAFSRFSSSQQVQGSDKTKCCGTMAMGKCICRVKIRLRIVAVFLSQTYILHPGPSRNCAITCTCRMPLADLVAGNFIWYMLVWDLLERKFE